MARPVYSSTPLAPRRSGRALSEVEVVADGDQSGADELESMASEADILTHLLYYQCERHFEQASESEIQDVEAWSLDAARRAMRAGWHFAASKIYCPACWKRRA